jgi:hypothetical protein
MSQFRFLLKILISLFLVLALLGSIPASANHEPIEGLSALIEIATSTDFVPTNAFLQSGEFECSSIRAYTSETSSYPEVGCSLTQKDHAVDVLMIYSLLPSAAELDACSIAKVRRKRGKEHYVATGALEF